jgi:hypothetical protein
MLASFHGVARPNRNDMGPLKAGNYKLKASINRLNEEMYKRVSSRANIIMERR